MPGTGRRGELVMDVRNCRQCGKLYNYIGGSYRNLCPSCIKQLEDKFVEIKEYIRDNKVAKYFRDFR